MVDQSVYGSISSCSDILVFHTRKQLTGRNFTFTDSWRTRSISLSNIGFLTHHFYTSTPFLLLCFSPASLQTLNLWVIPASKTEAVSTLKVCLLLCQNFPFDKTYHLKILVLSHFPTCFVFKLSCLSLRLWPSQFKELFSLVIWCNFMASLISRSIKQCPDHLGLVVKHLDSVFPP